MNKYIYLIIGSAKTTTRMIIDNEQATTSYANDAVVGLFVSIIVMPNTSSYIQTV